MKMSLYAIVTVVLVGAGTASWATSRAGLWVAPWATPRADSRGTTGPAIAVPPEPVTAQAFTLRFFRDAKVVPQFTVATLDGGSISSNSLRGKVTLINFWATWCGPCRAEIPDLIALQQNYRDQLQVIGISEDEAPADVVRRFVSEFKINYPMAMATPEVEAVFGRVTSLPTSYLIDPEGRIVQKHVGMLNAVFTEQETRALAGLKVNASIERVDPDKPTGLENAAQAKEIPGVELASLTPQRRAQALSKLNTDACTCGCELTVARCRVDDPSCGTSLPLARKIVADIVAAR